ncbi:hypothetical protein EDC01DRAFT_181663 [Geopyxis carbonaria]|nr:hypothetical protein EDC01DRAFT_181663 [Geopyxis carbonaria]
MGAKPSTWCLRSMSPCASRRTVRAQRYNYIQQTYHPHWLAARAHPILLAHESASYYIPTMYCTYPTRTQASMFRRPRSQEPVVRSAEHVRSARYIPICTCLPPASQQGVPPLHRGQHRLSPSRNNAACLPACNHPLTTSRVAQHTAIFSSSAALRKRRCSSGWPSRTEGISRRTAHRVLLLLRRRGGGVFFTIVRLEVVQSIVGWSALLREVLGAPPSRPPFFAFCEDDVRVGWWCWWWWWARARGPVENRAGAGPG